MIKSIELIDFEVNPRLGEHCKDYEARLVNIVKNKVTNLTHDTDKLFIIQVGTESTPAKSVSDMCSRIHSRLIMAGIPTDNIILTGAGCINKITEVKVTHVRDDNK